MSAQKHHSQFRRAFARTGVVVTLAALGGAALMAVAQPEKKDAGKGQPEMQLPQGWTAEDMQACIEAGTPGEMHEFLSRGAGTWNGQTKMWMAPGTPAVESTCTYTISPMMDGRYFKGEMSGDMPGMGPYNGFGIVGYDNAAGRFVSSWLDNHSTRILQGKGTLSGDRKKLEWTYDYHCPVTDKPATLREIETFTGSNTRTMEMWATDPKSGKEYKMMEIKFTKRQ